MYRRPRFSQNVLMLTTLSVVQPTRALHGCVLLLLWPFQGTTGSTAKCQDPGSAHCTISLEKLLDRAIQHAELIYLVSEESLTLFEEMFIPFHVRIPLSRTENACTTSTLSIPTSRSEVQENSDKWLLHSILFLIKFWIDPLVNLQTSLDRYDNAPMALISKTKWISGKLMNLEQGVTILIQKMLGEGAVMLEQNESLADYPVHFDMLESVLRDYTLLTCFKKDTHKMETFLKLLKCQRKGGLGCSIL
ncbi:somatolactin [Coregonus clupeaformis]|uniref:somatolactin n=1 Tax=Coregonus clupeaformis TaxID=59861 RepID=UPI001E1C8061|nr:somatolactin [Coregonus clupeaformis]